MNLEKEKVLKFMFFHIFLQKKSKIIKKILFSGSIFKLVLEHGVSMIWRSCPPGNRHRARDSAERWIGLCCLNVKL